MQDLAFLDAVKDPGVMCRGNLDDLAYTAPDLTIGPHPTCGAVAICPLYRWPVNPTKLWLPGPVIDPLLGCEGFLSSCWQ